MFNRWIETELLDVLGREGVGAIAFSPLAQGLLTNKYLDGVPEDSRVRRGLHFSADLITSENVARVRALNEIAQRRGQTLAQLAIAWVLRDPRVTSALVGASSVAQLEDTVSALNNADFDDAELAEIDEYAVERRAQHLGPVVQRGIRRGSHRRPLTRGRMGDGGRSPTRSCTIRVLRASVHGYGRSNGDRSAPQRRSL